MNWDNINFIEEVERRVTCLRKDIEDYCRRHQNESQPTGLFETMYKPLDLIYRKCGEARKEVNKK